LPIYPLQIIASAFTATFIGGAVQTPYFLSTNGGTTWSDFGTENTEDKTLAWKLDGTAFLTSILTASGTIQTFSATTSSSGFGSAINTFGTGNLDQPWLRTGPSNHVYLSYNNLNGSGGKTASVNVSADGGSTFTATIIDRVGGTSGQDA